MGTETCVNLCKYRPLHGERDTDFPCMLLTAKCVCKADNAVGTSPSLFTLVTGEPVMSGFF